MNVMFNPSFFLAPYCLPWQSKSKQHLQILTQHICKMILNVFFFFHMAWYYVNNCPLKWVFRRLFPWLLMRRLSSYIMIWKYLWVIIAAAAVHALKTASLWLHIISKGVLRFAFLQKPQLRICLLLNLNLSALICIFPPPVPEEPMLSENTVPHTKLPP